jgi:hypothetical protein
VTTNSTWWASSNSQNSSKSGARSKVLPPKELDGGNPLFRWTGSPVRKAAIFRSILGKSRQVQRTTIQPELHVAILPFRDEAAGTLG